MPNSPMMRDDWRAVGDALLVGRHSHASDRLFGQWCRENGFDDIPATARKDALWMAENWRLLDKACPVEACHPTHIRAAYNVSLTAVIAATEEEAAKTSVIAVPPPTISDIPPWTTAQVAAEESEADQS